VLGVSLIVVGLLLLGCGGQNKGKSASGARTQVGLPPHIQAVAFDSPSQVNGKFTTLSPQETGIDFVNEANSKEALLANIYAQAGLASGDVDNDGDIDFYILGVETDNVLYRNDGNFHFTDITKESGKDLHCPDVVSAGAIFFDLEADGDLDLWVAIRNNGNKLFINDGSGNFTDEAVKRGAVFGRSSISAAVFDVENDGDLDMYVCNNRDFRATDFMSEEQIEGVEIRDNPETGRPELVGDYNRLYYMDSIGKPHLRPEKDYLLVNDGTGFFKDQLKEAGLDDDSESLQALVCDFNEDGFVDILLSGDFHTPDHYYINNKDGSFTDRAPEMLRRTGFYSMGSDAGDLNGDGLMDAFVGDMAPGSYKESKKASGDMHLFRDYLIYYQPQQMMQNSMYLNRGDGWMSEIAEFCGTTATEWTWACRINDFNNDGIPELFAANGYIQSITMDWDVLMRVVKMGQDDVPQDIIDEYVLSLPLLEKPEVMFTAEEPLHYRKVSADWGFTEDTIGVGAVVQDFDLDGDLDIIVNNTRRGPSVFRNDLTRLGNNVSFDLRQEGLNREGLGAKLYAHCGDKLFTQHVILCRGYSSGESSRTYMSIGEASSIDTLEIVWPDGMVQTETNLPGGFRYEIQRNNAVAPVPHDSVQMFERNKLNFLRSEVYTGDIEYQKEPLLPALRSTLGGGAAVADFTADGNADIYFAGSTESPGKLFTGRGDGNFVSSQKYDGLLPAGCEAMAALAFEANGDGRTDLLITLGGNETNDPALLQDRLFLNLEGGMQEIKLPGTGFSSGAAAAADIDLDGDLDLLICARQIPYQYMVAAPAVILTNDGSGNFADATSKWTQARGLRGHISDAQFFDLNSDGRQDILLAEEFGNISAMLNNGESFDDKLALSTSGMWLSMAVADLDNDGDADIVAGNWGKNNKYKASVERPMTLVADDFDKNGTRDLIEVKFSSDGLPLPGRGRSCSGYAISTIPEKFPTWDDFANASYSDVYGPLEAAAERYEAAELYTCVLWNDGNMSFRSEHLPDMAQLSPTFGIVVDDFNSDGRPDLFLNDNFYANQPETSRWVHGYGSILLRTEEGGYRSVEPHESGIYSYSEGRGALALTLEDNRHGILIAATNGYPAIAINKIEGQSLIVDIQGRAANPHGIGAKLSLSLADGSVLTRWIQAGQGYLSSAVQPVSFGLGADAKPQKLEISWPDGSSQELQIDAQRVQAMQQAAQ
jgi:hypothetical protein